MEQLENILLTREPQKDSEQRSGRCFKDQVLLHIDGTQLA